jgi:hypothetical protein
MRALVPVILTRTKEGKTAKKSKFIEPNLVRKNLTHPGRAMAM